MQLHQLKTNRTKGKRVGRGGKRGKTSGRGHKGQKARAGHSIRPAIRDIIKKIPKLRGHGKNRARTVNDSKVSPEVVNLSVIDNHFQNGESVTPSTLLQKGLVKRQKGKNPTVKILGHGEITKSINIAGCSTSKSAEEKILKAGGKINSPKK